MTASRTIFAHITSIFLSSGVLMAGIGFVDAGVSGLLERSLGWIGGFMIFGLVAIISLPVGLFCRFLLGRLFQRARPVVLLFGAGIGVALIPVIYPVLLPNLSFSTHPFQLLVTHGGAGVCGGLIWLWAEQSQAGAD